MALGPWLGRVRSRGAAAAGRRDQSAGAPTRGTIVIVIQPVEVLGGGTRGRVVDGLGAVVGGAVVGTVDVGPGGGGTVVDGGVGRTVDDGADGRVELGDAGGAGTTGGAGTGGADCLGGAGLFG